MTHNPLGPCVLQPYCNPLPQHIFEGTGRAVLHGGEDVGVGVKGDGYRGVSQHLRDDLGIDVSRQEQRRARVPEVVEADSREPGLPKEWHEGPFPEGGGVYEGAPLRGEDEPLILVEVADALHLLELTGEVIPESLYRRVREP